MKRVLLLVMSLMLGIARVSVMEGKVVSAVLDGKWDMIEQDMISGQ